MKTYNRFPWSTEWNRDDIAERLAAFDLPPDAAVLDVGCADGAAGHYLTGFGHPYTGIDRDPRFIELASDAARRAGLELRFVRAELSDWRESAPVVLGFSFLHWKPDFAGPLGLLCGVADETLALELWLDSLPETEVALGHHAHPWRQVRGFLHRQGFPHVRLVGHSSYGRALVQADRQVRGYRVARDSPPTPGPSTEPCWWATRAGATFHLKLQWRAFEETRWLFEQRHPNFLTGAIWPATGAECFVAVEQLPLRDWVPTRANIARARAALDWLHGQGYIHGDLTREHLRPVGRGLKIIDYGGLTRIGERLGYTRAGHPISGEGLLATPELDWSSFATLC